MLSGTGIVSGLLSIFLLTGSLYGCMGNQTCTDCIHEISVPLLEDAPTDYPRVSELFGSIDTVYLENAGPDSYVPSVDEVKFLDDNIIVRSQNTLFYFDRQGKFRKRFSSQGNGYGHYRVIDRFDVLPSTRQLFIMDGHNSKIFVYGPDGSFQRQVEIDAYVTDFAVLPNGGFLFTNPIKYQNANYRRGLWRTDSLGRFEKQLVEFDPEFAHCSINNPYINHIGPDLIGFMGIEDNDRFYHVCADSVSVTCRMTTDIVIPQDIRKSDKVYTNPQREYTKCGYMETGRFLYFVATNYGANLVMAFTDKTNWKTYRMYVYTDEFNRNAAQIEQFPYLVSSYNGTMVGFFDAGTVLQQPRFSKMFPTITPDSNPVLLLYND